MQRRPLGRTGMDVSVLGFGAYEMRTLDAAAVGRLLGAALDAGLNVIDTAECYGASEELIGAAVGHRRRDYWLFTKCGHAAGLDLPDWDPRLLTASIARSLRRLRTDRVDLLQLHSCPLAVLKQGDAIAAIRAARDAGQARFLGYSGDGDAAVWAAQSGAFDCIQTSVNVVDQEAIERVLPLCVQRGLGVIAKRPLANVVWTLPAERVDPSHWWEVAYHRRLRALDLPCLRGGGPAAVAAALRFTVAQPGVHTAIVGTTRPERWAGNAAALAAGDLPAAEVAAIRARWQAVAQADWTGQT